MDQQRGGRRTARCGLHGRFYDSWSTIGCPDCANGRRGPGARGGGGRAVPLLLLCGALGIAHTQGWLPALSNTVALAPAPQPPARLDPLPYRAEIEALEAVLYRESELEPGDAERVGAAARALGERLGRELERSAAHEALLRLHAFAMEVESGAEAGTALPDFAGARRAWQRLRAELFAPAPWWRREGPALAAAQRPPPPRADVLDVEALERFASALDPLVADGRREMLAFAEPWVDVAEGSAAKARLAHDWREFARSWDARVTHACAGAPPSPALDDALPVVLAHQLLGDACHQLRVATVSPGEAPVPMKSWREESLDAAAARIAEARAQLAQALRF